MQRRRDTPKPHTQLRAIQLQHARRWLVHHPGKRRFDRRALRHTQLDVQRASVRFSGAVRAGVGQAVLPVTTGRQAMCRGRFIQQALIDTLLLPVPGLEMRAEHTEVDQGELTSHQAR
ncbi:hypothetical protein D3C85_804160 [compost metagenome]